MVTRPSRLERSYVTSGRPQPSSYWEGDWRGATGSGSEEGAGASSASLVGGVDMAGSGRAGLGAEIGSESLTR